MNQRFEELKLRAVREANVSHIDFDNMSQTDIRILGDIAVEKKFAELIVQEVTNVVLHYTDVDEGVRVARQHFGVE